MCFIFCFNHFLETRAEICTQFSFFLEFFKARKNSFISWPLVNFDGHFWDSMIPLERWQIVIRKVRCLPIFCCWYLFAHCNIAIDANQVEILSKFQNVLAMKVDYQENRFLRQNILIFRVTSTSTKLCTNMY